MLIALRKALSSASRCNVRERYVYTRVIEQLSSSFKIVTFGIVDVNINLNDQQDPQ